ncbi:MAG: diguanylate cyclase [Alphaproteobacteria bacterium]|nr:diguanylate cyclase [Alphaproteobacteria bacterium]
MGRALSIILVDDADEAGAEALAGLSALGLSVRRERLGGLAEAIEQDTPDAIVSFGEIEGGTGAIPHLSIGVRDPSAAAFLRAPAHAVQIAGRLRALVRLTVLEDMARLRMSDAQAAGVPAGPPQVGPDESTILFVGAPCPAFMRLQHAMAGARVETIAAFSTFTAFDYLHERAFDAVILNTDPNPELAHTVCSAMRRNTRLYHTPAILLTRGEGYAQADEAFARGASDVLSADADEAEMRERITTLGMERRRRRRAKAMLEACRAASLMDARSDLFGADFGLRHTDSLLLDRRRTGRRLTMVGLTAHAPTDAGPDRIGAALDQFAAMLRHCVRAEDLAVRRTDDEFYLALPNTPADEAKMVADRICAIAECTAYEGADPTRPFRLTLASNVIEPDRDASAMQAIEAALSVTREPRRFAAYA